MADLVTIDVQNHIADVRLNRPEKYNALSQDMFHAIVDAAEQLVDNRDVRAVVLSGNGRGFCAGLDMASFQRMTSESQEGQDKETRAGKKDTAGLLARDDRPDSSTLRKRGSQPAISHSLAVC